MTPSAHGAAETWAAETAPSATPIDFQEFDEPEPEFDLLAQADGEPEPYARLDDAASEPLSGPRVSAFETSDGLSSRGVIVASSVAAAGCAGLNLLLTGGQITFFFDLCFVVICLVSAMAVRRADLFTAGVLPPLLFAGVIAVISLVAPHAFESGPGVNKVFLTGLANNAAGLVFGSPRRCSRSCADGHSSSAGDRAFSSSAVARAALLWSASLAARRSLRGSRWKREDQRLLGGVDRRRRRIAALGEEVEHAVHQILRHRGARRHAHSFDTDQPRSSSISDASSTR